MSDQMIIVECILNIFLSAVLFAHPLSEIECEEVMLLEDVSHDSPRNLHI
jgi:hypothetical protein